MAAFALIFVPPLVAWRGDGGWCRALLLAVVVGLAAYLLSFILALVLDQPFGPLLALTLVLAGVASGIERKTRFRR